VVACVLVGLKSNSIRSITMGIPRTGLQAQFLLLFEALWRPQ